MNEPKPYEITLNKSANIVVGKDAIVYTDALQFGGVNDFALSYIVSCTGIPNVKVQMEQSIFKPTTDNIANDNFGVPRTIGDLDTALTSKTIQHMQLTPITLPWVRFKITEQTNLVTDTVINMWLTLQKKSFID